MAKVRDWHKIESRKQLKDLDPISVVWGSKAIKVILRDGSGKRMNLILNPDEAAQLVVRLTTGIHKTKT